MYVLYSGCKPSPPFLAFHFMLVLMLTIQYSLMCSRSSTTGHYFSLTCLISTLRTGTVWDLGHTHKQSISSIIMMSTDAHPQALPSSSDSDDIRKKFPRFRILILGRANAGKTTVLKKMCETNESPIIHDWRGRKVCCDTSCASNPSLFTSLIMLSD
jgi:hypothetical protein